MAPPKPPASTYQSATPATPKLHHHARHVQQHQQPPEEPSATARKGRTNGPASAQARSCTNPTIPVITPNPAAPEGEKEDVQAGEGAGLAVGLLQRSSLRGRPPPPAEKSISGKPLSTTRTTSSGELGPIERRGCVEGPKGFAGLLPGSASSTLPDNACHWNFTGIRPVCVPQSLDEMPERDPRWSSAYSIPLEAEEHNLAGGELSSRYVFLIPCWFVSGHVGCRLPWPVCDGGSLYCEHPAIWAIVGTPGASDGRVEGQGGSGCAPGWAGGAGGLVASSPATQSGSAAESQHQLAPTKANVVHTQHSRAMWPPRIAQDAPSGGHGGPGSEPGCAGGAGEHFASLSQAAQTDRTADFEHLSRRAIGNSGVLEGSPLGLWQANIPNNTAGGADCVEGT